jgi:hypothetical protein
MSIVGIANTLFPKSSIPLLVLKVSHDVMERCNFFFDVLLFITEVMYLICTVELIFPDPLGSASLIIIHPNTVASAEMPSFPKG